MLHKAVGLAVLLVVAACQNYPRNTLQGNFVGVHVDDLIQKWGRADKVEPDGKEGAILSWKRTDQVAPSGKYRRRHDRRDYYTYDQSWRKPVDKARTGFSYRPKRDYYYRDRYLDDYTKYRVRVDETRLWKMYVDPRGRIYRSESFAMYK